jgi:hypothetical protein
VLVSTTAIFDMCSHLSIVLRSLTVWSFGSCQKGVASTSLSERVRELQNPSSTDFIPPNIGKRVAGMSWTPSRTSLFYDFPTATTTNTPVSPSTTLDNSSLPTAAIVVIVIASICGFVFLIGLCARCQHLSIAWEASRELERIDRDVELMTRAIPERADASNGRQDREALGGGGTRQELADTRGNQGPRVELSEHERSAEMDDVERSPIEPFGLYGGPPPTYESIGEPDVESDFDLLNLENHEPGRSRKV